MTDFSGTVRTGCLTILVVIFTVAGDYEECIKFTRPLTGTIITDTVCSLEVEKDDCGRSSVRKVVFQARYFKAGADTPTVISVGSVSRKPYVVEWIIDSIPNQLFSGVSFLAEATLSNLEVIAVRQEGVFFLHKKIQRPKHVIPFAFTGTKKLEGEPLMLPAPRSEVSIDASIYWNEQGMTFLVNVHDPKFSTKLTPEQFASLGCEILLDPAMERKPFPGKEVFLFSVPLNGKPYRIMYKPVPNDSGSFTFKTSAVPSELPVSVTMKEQEGFSIYCPLPVEVFGAKIPQTVSCNLVAKTLADNNKITRTSWVKASLYETYSPYLWGELSLLERPVYMSRVLFGLVAFGGGLLITLLVSVLVIVFTRPAIKNIAEQSDEDRQKFTAIREVLDSFVVANVSIDAAAKALEMTPRRLSTLLRKTTGMTFHDYMMYSRIEIAKERLRSSHCSEGTIALACGFHSQAEMEKYFMRFNRQTPAKFRSEQQVV